MVATGLPNGSNSESGGGNIPIIMGQIGLINVVDQDGANLDTAIYAHASRSDKYIALPAVDRDRRDLVVHPYTFG